MHICKAKTVIIAMYSCTLVMITASLFILCHIHYIEANDYVGRIIFPDEFLAFEKADSNLTSRFGIRVGRCPSGQVWRGFVCVWREIFLCYGKRIKCYIIMYIKYYILIKLLVFIILFLVNYCRYLIRDISRSDMFCFRYADLQLGQSFD